MPDAKTSVHAGKRVAKFKESSQHKSVIISLTVRCEGSEKHMLKCGSDQDCLWIANVMYGS